MKLSAIDKRRAKELALSQFSVAFQSLVSRHEKEIFYKQLIETRSFILKKIRALTKRSALDGWIVCGSGLASLPNSKEIAVFGRIPVETIPHWFLPQAPGHGRELVIAEIGGQIVGVVTGRAHIYDTNYTPQQLKMITAPLIVAKSLGIHWLITTNAAGALDNGRIRVGDIVVDVDYVNQHGINPLIGPNDDRLGARFPGKANVVDPFLFSYLEQCIPENRLHLGIYTLASNAPMYEGIGDILNGTYAELRMQNPHLVEAFGMSFAMEAMVMQRFNDPSVNPYGFDRKVPWIGLTAVTNVIPKVVAPTKMQLRKATIANPNPTNATEVLQGGITAEKLLVPAVVKLCKLVAT